ncbi:MAG: Asp23/Gls24 family envelope stress response protein [Lachnospiraceae bacterium]|nr:Asp23/Gls24 family envelope stress response protein [Lachnospiraceae bacterium]
MADKRTMFTIRENESVGSVKVSEEVIAIISGLAAMEVKGVASMGDGLTKDIIARLGMKNLRSGVSVELTAEDTAVISVVLNIGYGFSIVEVSTQVQERIKTAVESMTGLEVSAVNVRVADVDVAKGKE